MAFYDWDQNGKKDIVDDYIEYNIYEESTKNTPPVTNGGISTFGAIIGAALTIFITAAICGLFQLEGAALVVVFLLLAVFVGGVIAWFFDEIGF